ncbi:MAG: hypothetical protein ACLQGP_24425 [Isosphaeraceae bacterium]
MPGDIGSNESGGSGSSTLEAQATPQPPPSTRPSNPPTPAASPAQSTATSVPARTSPPTTPTAGTDGLPAAQPIPPATTPPVGNTPAPGAAASSAQPSFAVAAPPSAGGEVAVVPGSAPEGGFGSLSSSVSNDAPPLLGDMSPLTVVEPTRAITSQAFPPHPLPRPPSPRVASSLAPSTRGFKISDNQSPMPQDRVYFTFNYFNNLNAALDKRFESPVDNLRAYRYIFGLEKTFDDGNGSIGIQLPLDTLTSESTITGQFVKPGGSSTALNDLTVFAKYVLKKNPKTGSLISVGLAVTPRDGPDSFAGANYLVGVNDTTVQPFLGYLWRKGKFYLHGFTAMDVPTSTRDVTMVYNDIGIGYFAYRNPNPDGFLMALIPTFEVHVNDPLTHRDFDNQLDLTGTPDVVNLTYGINTMIGQSSVFTFGVVTPVTGPRPFEYELVALINFRFGRSRTTRAPLPMTGG